MSDGKGKGFRLFLHLVWAGLDRKVDDLSRIADEAGLVDGCYSIESQRSSLGVDFSR